MDFRKNSRGITLIALVITIIVLLILAGVSLSLIAGGDGILGKAESGTKKYRIASARELLDLKLSEIDMDSYEKNLRKANFAEIVENLADDSDFVIVGTELGQVSSLNKDVSLPSDLNSLKAILVCSTSYTDVIFRISNEREITLWDENVDVELEKYTVKYDANGGSGEIPAEEQYEKNTEVTISFPSMIKEGYKFLGWATSAQGAVKYVENGEKTFKITKHVTLYAVWEKEISVKISVVDESGNESFKLTEGTQIRVSETSNASLAQNLTVKIGEIEIYSADLIIEENTASQNINLDSMKNLSSISFFESYDITAEVTSKNNQKAISKKSGIIDYTIGSANDLDRLASVVNAGNSLENEKIIQISDIELNKTTMQIGDENNKFRGTYNGKEHQISDININISNYNQGLFGTIENATIKNIVINGGKIVGTYNVGGIVGYNNGGTIENCKVKNLNVSATDYVEKTYKFGNDCTIKYANVGGIVGYNYNGNVKNCKNESSNVTGKYCAVGGIIGSDDGITQRLIKDCQNYANIKNNMQNNNLYGVGGIIGISYNLSELDNCENTGTITSNAVSVSGICGVIANGKIQECKNTGIVTGYSNVGGICGEIERIDETTFSNINECINDGVITSTGVYGITIFYDNASHNEEQSIAGGIVGLCRKGNIYDCKNKGKIMSTQSGLVEIGGVLGVGLSNSCVSKCANLVDLEFDNATDCVGGIVGYINQMTVEECYNIGKIQGNGNNAGGIAGATTYTTIKNCYNTAYILSNTNAGGIIGGVVPYKSNLGYEYLYNCYNIGETSGASGTTDPLVGSTKYLTYDYIYTLKSVYKSDGLWQYSSDGNFEAIDDVNNRGNTVKSEMLTALLNKNGQNKWTIDSTGIINNGFPYLVNNKP